MPTYYKITCQNKECNKTFEALPRSKSQKYCSSTCGWFSRRKRKKNVTCKNPKCNNILEHTQPKFCSRSCSNFSRKHSNKTKKKIGDSLRERKIQLKSKKEKIIYFTNCIICNSSTNSKKRKTCSEICKRKLTSINSRNNPSCGGQKRTHQSKVKNILNQEFILDSSYEVIVAQSLNQNNIIWIRPAHLIYIDMYGITRRYHPDFYLPQFNLYLDPKNDYLIKTDTTKINLVSYQNNVRILILDKDHLRYESFKNLVGNNGTAPL